MLVALHRQAAFAPVVPACNKYNNFPEPRSGTGYREKENFFSPVQFLLLNLPIEEDAFVSITYSHFYNLCI